MVDLRFKVELDLLVLLLKRSVGIDVVQEVLFSTSSHHPWKNGVDLAWSEVCALADAKKHLSLCRQVGRTARLCSSYYCPMSS